MLIQNQIRKQNQQQIKRLSTSQCSAFSELTGIAVRLVVIVP